MYEGKFLKIAINFWAIQIRREKTEDLLAINVGKRRKTDVDIRRKGRRRRVKDVTRDRWETKRRNEESWRKKDNLVAADTRKGNMAKEGGSREGKRNYTGRTRWKVSEGTMNNRVRLSELCDAARPSGVKLLAELSYMSSGQDFSCQISSLIISKKRATRRCRPF